MWLGTWPSWMILILGLVNGGVTGLMWSYNALSPHWAPRLIIPHGQCLSELECMSLIAVGLIPTWLIGQPFLSFLFYEVGSFFDNHVLLVVRKSSINKGRFTRLPSPKFQVT